METIILLVDDNPNVLSFVKPALERAGYQVTTAQDGLEALYQAEALKPDLLILDIEMPPPNGLEVCRQLRERGDEMPIIFLTVRDSIADLELGFEEIDGYLRIDAGRRKVWIQQSGNWQEVNLTPKEFDLLRYLVYNAGRAIGRTTLLEQVFDSPEDLETKTVEKHIWALRQKLEPDPREPRYIVNVRGVGYKLEDKR
jgi:two-component system alkaline phosphatase synthesis response regulator PhoP